MVLDDTLKRDVAILSTLAQFHCATVVQLHALCFPYHTLATARTTLFYLAEAHFIARSTWRLRGRSQERGQVWILTAKGHDLLQRYAPYVPSLARIDLGRPSTALEHEEWRVRIWIRTLLVRLLVHARQKPFLHSLAVQLPGNAGWPTSCAQLAPPEPDAFISVVWHPAERQSTDWLPWLAPRPLADTMIHYPIFVERMHARTNVAELLPPWTDDTSPSPHIPIVILQDEARYAALYAQVSMLPPAGAIRVATRAGLDAGAAPGEQRDEHNLRCGLPLLPADAVA